VRATWTLYRRELAAYLTSPMGWIVAAAVLLIDGLLFYAEALGPAAGPRLSADVLSRFFWNSSGLVAIAAVALSIRLIVEERQHETLVLLNTSPVRDREVVLGKFLSAFTFLAGITLLTLYMPLLIMVNGRISVGQVAVGYLGLLLLGAAVLSVGIFASALTRHQLVAAVLGSAMVGALFLFWPMSFVLDPPLSRLVAALSLHGRNWVGFQIGTLHLKDVFYYVSISTFFLLLSTKVLEAKRWE